MRSVYIATKESVQFSVVLKHTFNWQHSIDDAAFLGWTTLVVPLCPSSQFVSKLGDFVIPCTVTIWAVEPEPKQFGMAVAVSEPKIFKWWSRIRKFGFRFHSTSLRGIRVLQKIQWFQFSMDQIILEPEPKYFRCWSRSWNQKIMIPGTGTRAGAWNLSSGSTVLDD